MRYRAIHLGLRVEHARSGHPLGTVTQLDPVMVTVRHDDGTEHRYTCIDLQPEGTLDAYQRSARATDA